MRRLTRGALAAYAAGDTAAVAALPTMPYPEDVVRTERGHVVVLAVFEPEALAGILTALPALQVLGPVQVTQVTEWAIGQGGWTAVEQVRLGMNAAQHHLLEQLAGPALNYDLCPIELDPSDPGRYADDRDYQLALARETAPDGTRVVRGLANWRPLEVFQYGACDCGADVSSNRKRVACPVCGRAVGLT